MAKEDEEYRQKLKNEYGWQIVMLTPAQLKTISAQVRKTVWPKMEELVGKELMDKIYKNSKVPRP